MDVSVVVLSWEDVERTGACVRSLPAQAQIVVVDNGSSAPIEAALREMCAGTGARYVRSGTNVGYAKGMNLGVRHTSRGVVVLANNDVLASAEALHRLAKALEDPAVGAAFPLVRNGNGEEETDAGRFLSVPIGLGHLTGLGLVLPALRITTTPERADWLSGPFVALRRETLDRIGGVDESAFFYSEDLRLCWAVRRLGLRLAYVPDAVVTHENDTSSRRRWTPEEIARRKTREFIRASRDHGAGLASRAYAGGAVLRAVVARSPIRRAVARGAVEGLRSR
jgi:N-acetylglucosaminyl-diphospho-decaprenol L-rhamnosyltransferase